MKRTVAIVLFAWAASILPACAEALILSCSGSQSIPVNGFGNTLATTSRTFTVSIDVQKDAGFWDGPFLISRHTPARAREIENVLRMERFDLRRAFGGVIISETVTVDTNTGGLFQMLKLQDGRQFSMLGERCLRSSDTRF